MEAATLLSGLTASQREAVTSTAMPLRIVAGAGSGKTRVLTRRIAYRCEVEGIDPRHVLALTFTRKAAGELGQRLHRLGLRDDITAGTFHAVAYASLRAAWEEQRRSPPTLLDRKGRLVGGLLEQSARPGLMTLVVVQEIEWAKARLIAPGEYAAAAVAQDRSSAGDAEVVGRVYERYEEEKRRRNLVDFDDLLGECARLVQRDESFAAAQRWRHRHVFVDEFQDVNPLQYSVLQAWLGGSRDLCVVGDPDQSIYGWNGADASYMRDFAELYPGSTTIELEDNFRSTPEIVAASRSVLGRRSGVAAPEVHRPNGPEPVVVRYEDDGAESAGVAREVRDRHRPGGSWSDQAVLARTNAQLGAVERALRQAGVPTLTRAGARLVDRPEIKGLLRRLRYDGVAVAMVLADAEEELEAVEDDEVRAGLGEFVTVGKEYLAMVGTPKAGPKEFAAWLAALSPREAPGGGRAGGVELSTFHAAKGLEWRVVHIVGVEKGFVPIGHARRPEQVEEERRLLYVAMSRAEDELLVSWAASRRFGEKVVDRQRSPLLGSLGRGASAGGSAGDRRRGATSKGGLSDHADGVADVGDSGARRGGDDAAFSAVDGIALARARLGETVGPEGEVIPLVKESKADRAAAELFDALRAWRDGRARAAETGPGAVLPDEALRGIAAARVSTVEALSEVDGVGPVRARRYGDEVLELVRQHR